MRIEIKDMDHLGRGIGKVDGKVIFVPKAIPGDICEIDIYKENKKYSVGKIREIISSSDKRITAKCPYYERCGGCNLLNLDYQEQLNFKANKVKNVFKKYLDMDISLKMIGSNRQYGYRNKITYHVASDIGLISEFDDIVPINECLLVSDQVNDLFNMVKKENLSKVKKVTIREVDNGLILDVLGDLSIDRLKDKCIQIYLNGMIAYYQEDGYIMLGNKKFILSKNSFFQINTSNITTLYDEVKRVGNFSKNDVLIDLYCGVGSIGLYLADTVKSVLGIEIVPDGIKDAKENAKINGINNAKFICGDVSRLIDGVIDGNTLIVDPPRIGLDKHTASIINDSKITKVVYVSCDVMTLVRDLKLLNNYQISEISAVDMFPGTHHVESIVLLKLK